MTSLSEILSRSAGSMGFGDSGDHRESVPPMVENEVIGADIDTNLLPAPESEATPIATFESVPEFRSDDSLAAADDEQFEEPQAQIDRLVAAHETWLADVQITLPSHVGAEVLNYAIQRSLRTRGLSIHSTPIIEDGLPRTPLAVAVPTFRENVLARVPHTSEAEPHISNAESETELESDVDPAADPSELLEGTVELGFFEHTSIGGIAQFLVEVRGNRSVRLLEMKRDREGGTIISLGLRRPLPLKRVLLEMHEVVQVDEVPPDDSTSGRPHYFHVRLGGSQSAVVVGGG